MALDICESPSISAVIDTIQTARGTGAVGHIFGTCTVEWTGNRTGSIDFGDRVVLCKPDGAVSVHRTTGARAVARQGIGSSLQLFEQDGDLLLYAAKSGGNETLRVLFTSIDGCVVYQGMDDAEPTHQDTEKQLHDYIRNQPEAIEDGLRVLEHERAIPQGVMDFYAADADGNDVIIEVKHPYAQVKHVDQLRRYVSHFRKSDSSTVRGLLVAPEIGTHARRVLRDNNLEAIELTAQRLHDNTPMQTSFDEW
jgi:RecB family endonuclease NucS